MEEVESESDDAWFADDGITTEIDRLKLPCVAPDETLCFPDIRSTLCVPPDAAVTTTMLGYGLNSL